MSDAIYRELILEEYKHPKNTGKLDPASHSHHEKNPLCGDEITVYLRVEADIITDIRFEGRGCAISQAAASLFTEEIKGKNVEEVTAMDEQMVLDLLGIQLNPMRMKCAVLIMKSVAGALGV